MSAMVNESGFVWGVPNEEINWPSNADGWDIVAQNDWWMTAYARAKPEERCLVQILPYAWRFIPIVSTSRNQTTLDWTRVTTIMKPRAYALWCVQCNKIGIDEDDGKGCVWKNRHVDGKFTPAEGMTVVAVEQCPVCNPEIEKKGKPLP